MNSVLDPTLHASRGRQRVLRGSPSSIVQSVFSAFPLQEVAPFVSREELPVTIVSCSYECIQYIVFLDWRVGSVGW